VRGRDGGDKPNQKHNVSTFRNATMNSPVQLMYGNKNILRGKKR
jgi:hypothetical protein